MEGRGVHVHIRPGGGAERGSKLEYSLSISDASVAGGVESSKLAFPVVGHRWRQKELSLSQLYALGGKRTLS